MKKEMVALAILALGFCPQAFPAFFLDNAGLEVLLQDYDSYQERREIRYQAKASQFVGYVTGIVDALDGRKFCLRGGVNAEGAAAIVANYVRIHPDERPRHASDKIQSALAAQYPCKR
jgi:hypothetical protein